MFLIKFSSETWPQASGPKVQAKEINRNYSRLFNRFSTIRNAARIFYWSCSASSNQRHQLFRLGPDHCRPCLAIRTFNSALLLSIPGLYQLILYNGSGRILWSHSHRLQKPLLHTYQGVLVSQHRQILCLSLELLVGIYTRSKHLRSSSWAHLTHLLRHLTGSCRELILQTKPRGVQMKPTIITSQ